MLRERFLPLRKTRKGGLQSPQPPARSPPGAAKHPGQNTTKRAGVVKTTSGTRILTIGTVSFLARMKQRYPLTLRRIRDPKLTYNFSLLAYNWSYKA